MGSFVFKIALKNATKNATSKKETLESQCYQGFTIVNVNPLGLFSNLFIEDLKKLVEIINI